MLYLQKYLSFATNNEAPEIFHLWSGLSTISAAIGRRVKLVNGPFTFFPNLYCILVGDPGCGKSTALQIAKRQVRAIKGLPMTAEAMTVQALTRWMSGTGLEAGVTSPCAKSFKRPDGSIEQFTQASIFVGELVSFIGVDPHAWVVFLTDVFDEEVHEVKTKNKGEDLIIGPYVTMFGCLTPDISQQMQTAKIISTGFARRTIFVWGNERGAPMACPIETPEHLQAERECREYLNSLANVKGAFNWDCSKAWYTKWYEHFRRNINKVATPQTKGYYDSKNMQLFKVAMLVALSDSHELVIRPDHFEYALEFLNRTEVNLPRVFGGAGRNEDAPVAIAIEERLQMEKAPVPLKRLMGMFWSELKGGRPAFDAIIHHLQLTDKIIKWTDTIVTSDQITITVDYVATPEIFKSFKSKTPSSSPPVVSQPPESSSGFVVELGQPSAPSVNPAVKPGQEVRVVDTLTVAAGVELAPKPAVQPAQTQPPNQLG